MNFTDIPTAEQWAAHVTPGTYLFRYTDTAVGNPWPPVALDAVRRTLGARKLTLADDSVGLCVVPRTGYVAIGTPAGVLVVTREQAVQAVESDSRVEILIDGD